MTLDGSLIVGTVFTLLIACTLLVMLIDSFDLRETAKDVLADVLTLLRTLSWRNVRRGTLNVIGLFFSALAQRCFECADPPESPQKVRLAMRREWESRDVVIAREQNIVRARFGTREFTVKV